MNQASEYGKKSNFGPDFEPFGPNVDPKYFFRGFYFFEMLDIVASYRRIQFQETFFFFYQGFLQRHCRFTGQQGKGGDYLLFHSTTSTRSRTLRHFQLCM